MAVRMTLPTDGTAVFVDPGFAQGLTIDPFPDETLGFNGGDVITAIDGAPVDAWLGGSTSTSPALETGTEFTYDVARRGREVEVAAVLRTDPDLALQRLRGAGAPLIGLVVLGIGAYTVARRPERPAARALLVLGAGLTAYDVFNVLSADVAHLATAPILFGIGVGGSLIALAIWSVALAHLALSFPTPIRPLEVRPRWVGGVYGAVAAAPVGATLALMTSRASRSLLESLRAVWEVGLWSMAALVLVGIIRAVVLARRDPSLRRQVVPVALGFGGTAVVLAVANVVAGDATERWGFWFDVLAFFPMVGALSAAIVAGEFLDIRTTLNRAFAYSGLTGLLLAIFALTATATGALVGQSGFAESVPATAAVAILFAPARARVQQAVDRLFYGERGDPARVLGALARRLEQAVPPDEILPTIVESVGLSLRLPYVGIRTRALGDDRLACERGEPSAQTELVPLVYQGQRVGDLVVVPRRGERSLAASDHRLLEDVARHIAAPVSTSALLAEVEATRRQLAVAREQERVAVRRDLHDRLGSHLVGLSLQLEALEGRAADLEVVDGLRDAHASAERALDEVRRISRGLRPAELEELGLVAALETATARLTIAAVEAGMTWTASFRAALHLPELAATTEAAAYHIAVEALGNAFRHSEGSGARLRVGVVAEGSHLVVEVVDDGYGIADSAESGIGLPSMRDRAAGVGGTLHVASGDGGTTVRAELPLAALADP